jgi:TonB-linked SusC/RagA family outer membrane protein
MNKLAFCKIRRLFIVSLSVCLCLFALSAKAQSARITLKYENVPLENVMNEIEKQTRYLFVARNVDTATRVSVDIENKAINEALTQLLNGTGIGYKIEGANIILDKAETPQQPQKPVTVTGVVSDGQGQPVVGATVGVRGTNTGNVAGVDGRFSISVPAPAASRQLEVSSLGYETAVVTVGERTTVNVTLAQAVSRIDEVVVTALGIRRSEKALAYTVAKVASDELTTVRDANFINALSGKVAGAVINPSASGVGGASKVVMRGMKSILQSSNVLYVIDGIPMYNNRAGLSDFTYDSKGSTESIADINPDDIASMSVLTGAAAAALYGSEAANGAVLITTRQGEAGELKVGLSSGVEFFTPLWLPEFQSRYGTGLNGKAGGSTSTSWGAYIPEAARYNYSPEDFFQTGRILNNSVTVSGGTDRNQTYFSAAAVNSDGMTPNNRYDRYNFTFRNTSYLLRERLVLDASASYILQNDRNMTTQGQYSNPLVPVYLFPRGDNFDLVRAFERWNPARNIYEQFWPQGAGDLTMQNPYWIAYRNPRENRRNRYMLSASATYKITDWMDIAGRVRIDNTGTFYTQKFYATSNPTLLEGSKYGMYREMTEESRQSYGDVMLNINKTFGDDFSLSAQAGASISDKQLRGMQIEGPLAKPANVFNVQAIEYSKRKLIPAGWREQTQSVFASAEVGWRSQVFLTATGRNDWASQLAGSPNSSFFYPSVGISWLPSETFKLGRQVQYLKLRASWASVASPFPRELTYATYPYDNTGQTWDDRTNYPIGELLPERTRTTELGVDVRLLCGLSLAASWYHADTYNQTFNPQISASSGYSDMYVQTGHVRNTGVEMSFGYNRTWGGFTWDSGLNFSANRNRIVELMRNWENPWTGEIISKDRLEVGKLGETLIVLKEGGSMGDLYSTVDLRRDENGQIKIDETGSVIRESGLPDMRLGSVFPKANLSWRNGFSYKGVNMNVLLAARFGGVVYSATQANLDLYGVSETSAAARDAGGTLVNGRIEMNAESWFRVVGTGSGIPQYYTYDATNVRVQEFSLGYTIPRKWLKVCDATVSLVARNLWMIYCEAPFDPETVASTDNFYSGIDNFMMPSTRNLGFNVNIKF